MPCQATFKEHCQFPKCDCDRWVKTNPNHGGKIDCHKCGGWIYEDEGEVGFWNHQHRDEFPHVWFHKDCFNRYEHYYGLDKPID